jgi:hypothetical protein
MGQPRVEIDWSGYERALGSVGPLRCGVAVEVRDRSVDWDTVDVLNRPQPDPAPSDERPSWDFVVERTRNVRNRIEGPAPAWDRLVALMAERDRLGERKYGVRLRPRNGRDPLVDALQESLDMCVYLGQNVQERPGDLVAVGLLDAQIWNTHRVLVAILRRVEGAGTIAEAGTTHEDGSTGGDRSAAGPIAGAGP